MVEGGDVALRIRMTNNNDKSSLFEYSCNRG